MDENSSKIKQLEYLPQQLPDTSNSLNKHSIEYDTFNIESLETDRSVELSEEEEEKEHNKEPEQEESSIDYNKMQLELSTSYSINYGNFYILWKHKEFPILTISKNWKNPLLSILVILLMRHFYMVYILEEFKNEKREKSVFKLCANSATILHCFFVLFNQGIGGFSLGSSKKVYKEDQ
jgi:hypothetical protein